MTAASASFPLLAVGGSGTGGSVGITALAARSFSVSLVVHGLPSGVLTAHTVHVHAGSCAAPYAGRHLYVLGTLVGDRQGMGTLHATGPGAYVAPGRYLIVYASSSPDVIVGCADLAPVAG
jgi:hypothetical protein